MVARSSPSGPDAASILHGPNMTVDALERLMPVTQAKRFFDWDYFCTGSTASGQIGRMGWMLLGSGTPAYARLDCTLASVAKATLSTSNATNDRANLLLGTAENVTVMNPLESVATQGVWRMNNSLVTKRAFFGWNADFSVNPITGNTSALGLAYDSSVSPNFLIVNRIGLTLGSAVDTAVAVPANTGELVSIVQDEQVAGRFRFYIGSISAGGVVTQSVLIGTVDLPLAAGFNGNFGFGCTTLDTVVSTIELGYWGLTTTLLPGLLSSEAYADEGMLLSS